MGNAGPLVCHLMRCGEFILLIKKVYGLKQQSAACGIVRKVSVGKENF